MRTLALVFLVFCFIDVCAQDVTNAEDAYAEGLRLLDEREYPDALKLFEDIIQKYPSSPLALKSQFYVGYAALKVNNTDKAKNAFLGVVKSTNSEIKRGSKDVDEPYPSKHWSARYLADMSIDNSEWSEAELYITMFDKDFLYQVCCGNSRNDYEVEKASMYARVHEGQGKITEAVGDLLPLIFSPDNSKAVDRMSNFLEHNYTNDKIVAELEAALSSIDKQKILTFFGAKVDQSKTLKARGSVDEIRKSVRKNRLFVSFLGEPED